jgi:hypothetical protein
MTVETMEKIDPLADHLRLKQFAIGHEVEFRGKPYKILRRTTLASGEAALVLGGDGEQFVVGALQFFAGVKGEL